jgi:Ca2+-binding RTX toxin-like protein
MRKLIGVAGLALFLAVAPGALASTATSSATRITVSGQGTERNTIRIAYETVGDLYRITDAAGITPTAPCVVVDANTVTCPGAGITTLTVNGGNGNDTVELDRATIPLTTAGDIDGDAGDDILGGANGDDAITGDSGRDTVNGFFGSDSLRGGTSSDVLTYADRTSSVAVTVGSGNNNDGSQQDKRQTGNQLDTVAGDFETVIGGSGPDVLRGDKSAENLIGGSGNDVLGGDRGADALIGLLGDDTLVGDDGNDVLRGAAGNDVLLGMDDDDRLAAGPGNDFLFGGFGSDVLKGKSGIDRLRAKDGTRDVKINCGPGPNSRESAKRDKRLDPRPRGC